MPQPQRTPASDTPSMLDLARFDASALNRDPYDYVIVPNFIPKAQVDRVVADYPAIGKTGSFPLHALQYGPAFAQLLAELEGEAFRAAVEKKFNVDLTGRPTMITVRGMCGTRDGNIHTDTESKIISLLLYMNNDWQEKEGGRLRILRSKDMEDVAAEVPPESGTLLIFRRAENSWHGHKLHIGERKVIQLNWVTEQKFADRNVARHSWSSFFKKLNPFSSEY